MTHSHPQSESRTWSRAPVRGCPGRARVIIVGAGFAGMEVAKALQNTPAQVTVVDRHNYTLFQPLLYQVATAALSPADVATPIRTLLHARNVEMLLDEVIDAEPEQGYVSTASGRQLDYDFLVLAPGSRFNYFGHVQWATLAPAPKSLTDAIEIRRRLLLAFELAEMCEDANERQALMSFAVIGAGATGVEMAGAMAELAKATLARDFRKIDPADARIMLVEAGTRLLQNFPEALGNYAKATLTGMGVQILLDTKVDHIDHNGVFAEDRHIDARTVIWAAGVKAANVAKWLRVKPGSHGAVKIESDFSVPHHPNIFVIGDAAERTDEKGKLLPGLAAVAKQEGQYVGRLLSSRVRGSAPPDAFRYRDYGTMATIGRSAAVADIRGLRFRGTFAWLLWGIVHLYFLIGLRNRVVVLVNWFWAWCTYAHGARLISGQPSQYAASSDDAHTQGPAIETRETQALSNVAQH